MSQPDPIINFLGFDPGMRPPTPVHEPMLGPAPHEAPTPMAGRTLLADALLSDPYRVMLMAMRAIMRSWTPRDKRTIGGAYGAVKVAACKAMREIAAEPEFRDTVLMSGWIVGKAEDPNF